MTFSVWFQMETGKGNQGHTESVKAVESVSELESFLAIFYYKKEQGAFIDVLGVGEAF